MRGSRRLRQWVLPVTVIPLAVAGVGILFLGDLLSPPDAAPESGGFSLGETTPPPMRQARRPVSLHPVAEEPPPAPPVEEAPPARPAPRKRRPLPVVTLPKERVRPQLRETPEVLGACYYLNAMARKDSLEERLRVLDDFLDRLPDDAAVKVVRGLLDSELPGSFWEAETLRLRLIARLGSLPGPRADAALLARLDAEQPRPQRLIALEMIAQRPGTGRGEVEAIAYRDHDLVVQEKAKWVLQRWQ